MPADEFARERLTIFEDDKSQFAAFAVISAEAWAAAADVRSQLVGDLSLAVEVTSDLTQSVIAVAGRNEAGKFHLEVIDMGAGTEWVPGRVSNLLDRWPEISRVSIDPGGPAGFLIGPLAELGVKVHKVTAREAAHACGLVVASVEEAELVHLDTAELNDAVQQARRRDSGDVWYWARAGADESIQLIAATLALGQVPTIADPADAAGPVYVF